MSPAEVLHRVRDAGLKAAWRSPLRPRRRTWTEVVVPAAERRFATPLPGTATGPQGPAAERLLAAADRVLAGGWPVFDRVWDSGPDPDWFRDPRTGVVAPREGSCFTIDHRDERRVGNVKYVWEPSRHHHLTVLAAAYRLIGDPRYAERTAVHLRSWWRENRFLRGIHWTSGIEIGMRLVAWTWIRRLLDGWPGVRGLFEESPEFLRQLADHQRYLAALPSHGSSANNHLVAEAAGLFASACAFPFLRRSAAWAAAARRTLRREIPAQTFPDGLNRELATDYHGFVLELALVAVLEGEAAGRPLGAEVWTAIRRMTDAVAALLDAGGRPPRQGDGDDAHGLLLDDPDYDRWADLLATGDALFGAAPWWPRAREGGVRTSLWTALAHPPALADPRAPQRPALFPDAGLCLLRSGTGAEEIWCRCDHGPLGYLSTAAHGHADALSIEVRAGGVELLVDPGTYCYHGEPGWRAFFRSTIAHNTLELGGVDQSPQAGPFLWLSHADSRLLEASGLTDGAVARWSAEHHGYGRLRPPAVHRRTVELDRERRRLTIRDSVSGGAGHPVRLAFVLAPGIEVDLAGPSARLAWPGGRATLELPPALAWEAVRGQVDPPLGWTSSGFGRREPTTALVGRAPAPGGELVTGLWIGGPAGG